MSCSICALPIRGEIVQDWIRSSSLRRTAQRYGVGYKSLHRHIRKCLAAVMAEQDERHFQEEFANIAGLLRRVFAPPLAQRPRRHRSIITKPVQFTWSRRAWKSKSKIGPVAL